MIQWPHPATSHKGDDTLEHTIRSIDVEPDRSLQT